MASNAAQGRARRGVLWGNVRRTSCYNLPRDCGHVPALTKATIRTIWIP